MFQTWQFNCTSSFQLKLKLTFCRLEATAVYMQGASGKIGVTVVAHLRQARETHPTMAAVLASTSSIQTKFQSSSHSDFRRGWGNLPIIRQRQLLKKIVSALGDRTACLRTWCYFYEFEKQHHVFLMLTKHPPV